MTTATGRPPSSRPTSGRVDAAGGRCRGRSSRRRRPRWSRRPGASARRSRRARGERPVGGRRAEARRADLDAVAVVFRAARPHERPALDRRVAVEQQLERRAVAALERVRGNRNPDAVRPGRDVDRPREALGSTRPPRVASCEPARGEPRLAHVHDLVERPRDLAVRPCRPLERRRQRCGVVLGDRSRADGGGDERRAACLVCRSARAAGGKAPAGPGRPPSRKGRATPPARCGARATGRRRSGRADPGRRLHARARPARRRASRSAAAGRATAARRVRGAARREGRPRRRAGPTTRRPSTARRSPPGAATRPGRRARGRPTSARLPARGTTRPADRRYRRPP